MHRTVIPTFHCPTRRAAIPYKGDWPVCYNSQANIRLPAWAKNDYAGNAGDGRLNSGDDYWIPMPSGSGVYAQADAADDCPRGVAQSSGCWTLTDDPRGPYRAYYCSGITYYRSEVKNRQIKDGLSKTYFAAERHLMRLAYDFTYPSFSDNQSLYTGFEWDNTRLTNLTPDCRPRQYQNNVPNYSAFGSAHVFGFNAVLCDGGVLPVSFDIDRQLHRRLGNRKDSLPVDMESLF
jgi:hypothetical protein